MIPPERIRFISREDPPEVLLELARQSGHTRYPVSRTKAVRDIFAYVVIKKAVPASRNEMVRLVAEARPIHAVGRHATLMAALHEMLQHKEHLLAVTDERGGVRGDRDLGRHRARVAQRGPAGFQVDEGPRGDRGGRRRGRGRCGSGSRGPGRNRVFR